MCALMAEVGPIACVVDVPVGTGRMANRIRAHRCRVIGVDASADMLAVARSRDSASDYLVGRAESLSEVVPAADCVVSVRLFGHLPAEAKALALHEFRKVAAKGAVVFFARDSWWLRLRRAVQERRGGRRLEGWTPVTVSQARHLAETCGFVVLGVRGLLGPFSETHALILVNPMATPRATRRDSQEWLH
jgi:Methylase involved in ubiquinone/menaquinone biosynthesis